MTKRTASALGIALVSLTVAVGGCESMPFTSEGDGEPDPALQAVVSVEDPEYGGEFPVTVTMSSSSARDAVGKLRTEKWDEAVAHFQELVDGTSNRDRRAEAYFGLAVAHEAQGQYAEALAAYESAFELANRSEYADGIARARTALDG